MIKVSPVPLYWILKLAKPQQLVALEQYQMEHWGFKLEIPEYPSSYYITPIVLTTEEAGRLMKQTRRHFK